MSEIIIAYEGHSSRNREPTENIRIKGGNRIEVGPALKLNLLILLDDTLGVLRDSGCHDGPLGRIERVVVKSILKENGCIQGERKTYGMEERKGSSHNSSLRERDGGRSRFSILKNMFLNFI